MTPTRVVLVGLPRLLRELIEKALAEIPDVEVVGEVDHEAALEQVLADTEAEVVIASSTEAELPHGLREVLEKRPDLRLLTFAENAEEAFLWQLRLERVPVGDLSPERLAGVLQATSRSGGS